MDHRVKALKIRLRQVSDVFANLRNLGAGFPKSASIEVRIEADHFMTGRMQD